MSTSKKKRKPSKSKGLGDDVEKVLKSKPIKPITEAVKKLLWKEGEDCGCDKRKEVLNKLFPRKQPLCMTEDEYKWWVEFKKVGVRTFDSQQANKIEEIYNRLFQPRKYYKPCRSCTQAWQDVINQINTIYDTYNGN